MHRRPVTGLLPHSFSGRFLICRSDSSVPDGPFPGRSAAIPDGEDEVTFEPCSDVPPYGGPDPSECAHPLAYADRPGPSVFFVKMIERRPTATLLKSVASEILPFPLEAIPKEDRADWTAKIRKEAVARTDPREKVVPGLLHEDRICVVSRTVDDGLVSFLSGWLGLELRPDPVLWSSSDETSGRMLLLSVLDEEIDRRKKADVLDFAMEECKLSVGSSTIRGPMKRIWTAMRSLFASEPDSEPVVESAVLSVRTKNGASRLHVDEDGLFRVEVPKGRGGLPRDRFLRSLRDLDEVSAVARKELRAARGRTVSAVG